MTRVGLPLGRCRSTELAAASSPTPSATSRSRCSTASARPIRASKVFHSGDHPTLRLRTREGYEVTGTHNHPVLCLVDVVGVPMLLWKRLDEISRRPRRHLAHAPAERRRARDRRALGRDPARRIRLRGWVAETRAGFNNIDREFFDRSWRRTTRIVGGPRYVSARVDRVRERLHELDVHNLDALQDSPLGGSLGSARADKRIPELVWRSTAAFKRAFLQALFTGDGSSSLLPRKTIQISYSTYSEQLARDVQDLLLEFGVISRSAATRSGEYKVVITNRRDARLFSRSVGFMGAKQRKLARASCAPSRRRAGRSATTTFRSSPLRPLGGRDALTRLAAPPQRRPDRALGARWRRHPRADRVTTRCGRSSSRWSTGDYYYAEVESVEPAGVQPVYSLRVDSDDHAFLTNGFVSHNTEARLAPLAPEMLRDLDADTVDFRPNYDETRQEPTVLPARFPNLLVNGCSGIAVGMATKCRPTTSPRSWDALVR